MVSEITQRSGHAKRKPVRVLFRQLLCRREICFDIGLEQEVEISELGGGIWVLGRERRNFSAAASCAETSPVAGFVAGFRDKQKLRARETWQLFEGFEAAAVRGCVPRNWRRKRNLNGSPRQARRRGSNVAQHRASHCAPGRCEHESFPRPRIKRQIERVKSSSISFQRCKIPRASSRVRKSLLFLSARSTENRASTRSGVGDMSHRASWIESCYFAPPPACDRLVVDSVRIFGMKLDAQVDASKASVIFGGERVSSAPGHDFVRHQITLARGRAPRWPSFVNAVRAREFPKELARFFRSLSQIRHLREQIGQLETGRIILRRALDRQAGELDRLALSPICGSSARRGRASSVWIALEQSLDDSFERHLTDPVLPRSSPYSWRSAVVHCGSL